MKLEEIVKEITDEMVSDIFKFANKLAKEIIDKKNVEAVEILIVNETLKELEEKLRDYLFFSIVNAIKN